ncbi:putative methylase [Methanohalophilus sp. WG1-DM]|nr:putative methylase [Methanohalophilus sp. WG1-DM]
MQNKSKKHSSPTLRKESPVSKEMKQRKLEMLLQKVRGFEDPDPTLEQYATPAPLAAELLHFAYMKGDIEGTVFDMGCGTGILAIGAALLGATKVVGYDSDPEAINVARENAVLMDVEVEFVNCPIEKVNGKANTVVMNPPFGAQCKGNDRPFLSAALNAGNTIYSIHNSGSFNFIRQYIKPSVVTEWYTTSFPLKRTFKFHKKDVERIEVEIYRINSLSHHNY